MRRFQVLPLHHEDLKRLLIIFTSEPKPRTAPRIFCGPKPRKNQKAPVISDEQVLAIRKMKEWYGMTYKQISEAVGYTENQITPILMWYTRTHLDPGPAPSGTPFETGKKV